MLGMSMEARMSRIETMMEALVQERGARITPRGSAERDSSASEGMQADIGIAALLDPFVPEMSMRAPSSMVDPYAGTALLAAVASANARSEATIRVGTREMPFPEPKDYQTYLDYYFFDINPTQPCINEAEFRIRSEKMLSSGAAEGNNIAFLALHYAIFSCVDISSTTSVATQSALPGQQLGWRWIDLANGVIDKRQISGQGDLSLLQFLIVQVILPNSSNTKIRR